MGAITDPCRCANFGTDRQQRVVLCRPRPSDDHGHRLDLWRGDLSIMLGHDHKPQRLDTSAAPAKVGSIFGCHRHDWLLLLQALHQDIRPSLAQDIQHLTPLDILVRYHHHRHVVTACHAREADFAP
jgi:hypothetical protein